MVTERQGAPAQTAQSTALYREALDDWGTALARKDLLEEVAEALAGDGLSGGGEHWDGLAADVLRDEREARRKLARVPRRAWNGSAKAAPTTTTTQHDCNGPAWGKLTRGCPRCEELWNGAPARPGWSGASGRYR
jgi:hypothetical protein